MDTRVPFPPDLLYFWESEVSILHVCIIGIFFRWRRTRVGKTSRWNRRPLQGHGSHLRACDRVERSYCAASQISVLGLLCLCHCGFTLAKPLGSTEEARQSVVRGDRTRTENLPKNEVLSLFVFFFFGWCTPCGDGHACNMDG